VTRNLLGVFTAVLVAGTVLSAREFWDDKVFTTWSDQELQRILTDSPWSLKAEVVDAAAAPARDGGAGGRGGRGGRGGADGGRGPAQFNLTVTWRTALPMKQALIRSQIGPNAAVPAEAQGMLDQMEDAYAVSISGLPLAAGQAMTGVQEATQLLRPGKAPILPEQILTAPQADSTLMMLAIFPRSAVIAVEDGEVEFVSQIANLTIKRKFNLKEMVYKGRLAL
jgi:hypothetical protein